MLCVILGTPGGGTDLEGVGSYNVSDVSHQSDFCSSLPPPPPAHTVPRSGASHIQGSGCVAPVSLCRAEMASRAVY